MSIHAAQGGVIRDVSQPLVATSGVVREVDSVWGGVGGVVKELYSSKLPAVTSIGFDKYVGGNVNMYDSSSGWLTPISSTSNIVVTDSSTNTVNVRYPITISGSSAHTYITIGSIQLTATNASTNTKASIIITNKENGSMCRKINFLVHLEDGTSMDFRDYIAKTGSSFVMSVSKGYSIDSSVSDGTITASYSVLGKSTTNMSNSTSLSTSLIKEIVDGNDGAIVLNTSLVPKTVGNTGNLVVTFVINYITIGDTKFTTIGGTS